MSRVKEEDFRRLEQQIKQWNIDHFDLFELSQPNENLEFHGVIRFYFQDEGEKVSTKCVRVSSTASTQEVVDVLVEKFRPDMRMLTPSSYSLYEVHVNGEERKLTQAEKPLLVQLNWGKDVREGRFLLKRDSDNTVPKEQEFFEMEGEMKGFKRKLSKREKKEKKKRDKERIKNKENFGQPGGPGGDRSVAEKHYNELPETSFTRSISNPEAVMRRRRQQKLEKKLEQIRNQGPNSAGTLKIYGESLKPDVPYKTLLLSSSDPVWYVIKETLEKYGLEKENPKEYCLVQVSVAYDEREYHGGKMGDEKRLELDECPLAIAMQHPPTEGTLMFEIRRKTVDEKRKAKALRAVSHEELRYNPEHSKKSPEKLPYMVELFPDGSENPRGRRHRLQVDVTEVGSDEHALSNSQALVIPDRSVQPRHCVLAHTDGGIITVTPNSQEAETYVNNMRIYETTILKNGMTVSFGRNNLFRFVHPNERERQQKAQFADDIAALQKKAKLEDRISDKKQMANFNETTFDLDGHVETHSRGQFPRNDDLQRSPQQKDVHMSDQQGHLEDALPVALEFREEAEDNFLSSLITDVNGANVSFKLAPTYTVYMAVRYRLSNMYRPDMSPSERAHRLTSLINTVANLVQQAIQDQHDNPSAMSFWMANASELLHFCKQDHDVHPFSQDAQEVLAESVQIAFHHLVLCLQQDLQGVMVAFLDENEDMDDDEFMNEDTLTRRYKGRPILSDVLNTLSSAMHLLRRCRVNAALTIQLFSQLFHFINMSLFNTLVTQPQMRLCTMKWGIRLKRRLGRVEAWAEKQGLELAADCHLCRIIQAAHLLQAPKSSPDHIAYISSTCFKLNSLQLRTLLEKYIPEPNEPPIPQTLIEKVVAVAENMADELTRTDGRDIQLEEDPDLQLPFLLPEDGYSCDIIRGVPNGLLEFLEPLSRSGLCRAMVQQEAVGDWTVYMVPGDETRFMEQNAQPKGVPPGQTKPRSPAQGHPVLSKEAETLRVTFSKVSGSMGLSIVAAKGETQTDSGIYIKSVVPGGAAAQDGRLAAGDQLLEVDGKNLIGLSQEKAAELMTRTGQTVSLKVAKQGAIYHGLAKLLSQPSPILQQRGGPRGPSSPGQKFQNPQHHHEEAPPPYFNGEGRDYPREPGMVSGKYRPGIQNQLARSSPSLNSDISNSERPRATSTSNVRDDRHPQSNQHPQVYKQPGVGEIDSRSKSTSNLNQPDMYGRQEPQPIRGATSTSVLPRNQQPNRDHRQDGPGKDPRSYDPRSRLDPHQHQQYNGGPNGNYENQPRMDQARQPNQPPNNRRFDNNSPNYSRTSNDSVNKWSPPQQGVPNKRTSSSSSSSLQRDDNRPRSAYISQPDRPEAHQTRPKSEEFEASRVREWQERNERSNQKPQLSPNSQPNDRRAGYPDRPGQPYGQQGPDHEPPRSAGYNQQRQVGYYENTSPRPQDGGPQDMLDRPQVKAKPVVSHKPAPSKVQHIEVSRSQVPTWKHRQDQAQKVSHIEVQRSTIDRRNNHPEHYDQKRQPEPQPQAQQRPDQRLNSQSELRQQNNSQPNNYQQNNYKPNNYPQNNMPQHPSYPSPHNSAQPHYAHNPQMSYYEPQSSRDRFPPSRDMHGHSESHELPPPPEVPPELPPPPEEVEELPPPPPPPSSDYRLEQTIRQEQERLMQQLNHPYDGMEGYRDSYRGQHEPERQQNYPEHMYDRDPYDSNHHSPSSQQSDPYSSQPNYQNINRFQDGQERQYDPRGAPSHQPPHPQQTGYHPRYDPAKPTVPAPDAIKRNDTGGQRKPPVAQKPKPQGDKSNAPSSPWEREEKEKEMKKQEMTLKQIREQEISELQAKLPYVTPQEEDRLKKLRLEQEFQRRVEEVDKRGDDDDDSDNEVSERVLEREQLIQNVQDDLLKTKLRLEEMHHRHRYDEYEREKDRMERLQRKLEIFEKEREQQRARQRKKQEMKEKKQEEYLQRQREMRERQRREFEENKRLLMQEEEKTRQRKMEEIKRKRELEREQMREMQEARDAEEATLRAEARKQEEEFARQRQAQLERERQEQQREIRVAEERKRLEMLAQQNQTPTPYHPPYNSNQFQNYPGAQANYPYQQPPHLAQQQQNNNIDPYDRGTLNAPPPPERKSSYEYVQHHHQQSLRHNDGTVDQTNYMNSSAYRVPVSNNSSMRNNMDFNGPGIQKKSVSFNTQLETQINTYSVSSEDDHSQQRPSYSSHRSSSSSSQDPQSPNDLRYSYGGPGNPAGQGSNDVFQTPPQQTSAVNVSYKVTDTPGVVGAQEVYRDPRSRIQAKKAQQPLKGSSTERMSFREKMKFFAKEAGEGTPTEKPKASRVQRTIESQMNGQ